MGQTRSSSLGGSPLVKLRNSAFGSSPRSLAGRDLSMRLAAFSRV